MELINIILQYMIVPLFIWVWLTDRKLVKLEAEQITKKDIDSLYKLIRELTNKIDDKFVSVNTCNFRHKKS